MISCACRFASEIAIKTLHPASRRHLNGSVKKSDIMVVKQAGEVWCEPAKHKALRKKVCFDKQKG